MRRIFQATPLQFWCFPSTYLDLSSNTLAYFPSMPPSPPSSIAHTLSGVHWPCQLLPHQVQKSQKDSLASSCNNSMASSVPSPVRGLGYSSSGLSQNDPQKDAVVCCHQHGSVEEQAAAQPACTSRLCSSDRWHPAGCDWKDTAPKTPQLIGTNGTCSSGGISCNTSPSQHAACGCAWSQWREGSSLLRPSGGTHTLPFPPTLPASLPAPSLPFFNTQEQSEEPKMVLVRMTDGFGFPHEEVEGDRWQQVPPVPMASCSAASQGEASKKWTVCPSKMRLADGCRVWWGERAFHLCPQPQKLASLHCG